MPGTAVRRRGWADSFGGGLWSVKVVPGSRAQKSAALKSVSVRLTSGTNHYPVYNQLVTIDFTIPGESRTVVFPAVGLLQISDLCVTSAVAPFAEQRGLCE